MNSFTLEFSKDGQHQQFSFDGGQVAIGRDRSADFVLDHPTVSRQHALIVSDQEGHRLVVLSRNGMTAVDGERVQGDVRLYDGSRIHFGSLDCTYRSQNAPPRPQAHSGAMPSQSGPMQPSTGPQPNSDPTSGPDASQSGLGGWQPPGGWDSPSGPMNPMDQGGQGNPGNQNQRPQSGQSGGMDSWGDSQQSGGDDAWGESDAGSGAVMSWDEIAAQADEGADGPLGGKTDFEKMQEAQAKAEKQSKGTSPVLLVGVVLAIAFVAFVYLRPTGGGVGGADGEKKELPTGEIAMTVDCVGKASCEKEAIDAYKVGKAAYDKMGADVTNLYQAHRQFKRAEKLLEKGDIGSIPAEMADIGDLKTKTSDELNRRWKRYWLNIREHRKRKDYQKIKAELDKLKSIVPDDKCDYHQWALDIENKLKEDGKIANAPVY